MTKPLSSVLVRLLYVLSWPALAGAILFGGYSWWYFDTHKSTYGLSDLEKIEILRMKENCLWADIGWLSVVTVGFLVLKALYFVLKGEAQSDDQEFYDTFNLNFIVAFSIMVFATIYTFSLTKL